MTDRRAALEAYLRARTPDAEREAWARLAEIGMVTPVEDRDVPKYWWNERTDG